MRIFLFAFILLTVLIVGIAGFRGEMTRREPIEVFPDMDRQLKLRPQTDADFWADGLSSRLPVEGTVARGAPFQETEVNTGREPGTTNFVEHIPVPVTEVLMARGRGRYDISCRPCHGALGDGNGIVKQFGMAIVANLHDPRMIEMSDGELFNTITQGKGLMGGYGANITIADRWAIIAYVRALQRSRLGNLEDVPEAERATLN